MKPIASTLTHRLMMPETGAIGPPEQRGRAGPYPTLVLCHGRGADEDDLAGLARYLDEHLLVLSVRAPFPFEFGGYTWYDAGPDGTPDVPRFRESYERLSSFLDDALRLYPVDQERFFLLGFSMGAAMSLVAALSRPALFRGVSINSGYLPQQNIVPYTQEGLASLGMLIAHGTEDPVIPVARARQTKLALEELGVRPSYTEYRMGHEINDASLGAIVEWMRGLL